MNDLLAINESTKEVYYLGYEMELTVTEFRILWALYNSDATVSLAELQKSIDDTKQADRKSIAVHVCHINKKAEAIGGRKIILNKCKAGYRLTEYL